MPDGFTEPNSIDQASLNLAPIDWDQSLSHLVELATALETQDQLKKISPLKTQAQAEKSLSIIEEAQRILESGQRPHMESLDLFHSWSLRLKKNALLKPMEIKDIRLFLLETHHLSQVLEPLTGDWIHQLKPQLMPTSEALLRIDRLMTPQGDIRVDASPTLYGLHQEKQQMVQNIQQSLDEFVKQHDYDHALQDKYVTNREGRWVIPIKSGMRHELNGIIHATSSSKQTVFMEPQTVVPFNNRMKQIEVEIEKEVEKLLQEISDVFFRLMGSFDRTKAALLEVDGFLAKAQFANLISAHGVGFTKDHIALEGLKHPLMVLKGEKVVPNNLHLGEDKKILLLSGPNAGGKTVLLKAFGLAAHMARCGLPLCVEPHSQIPFFQNIFVALGDSQNVDQSLSTFAGHLKILHGACEAQGPQALILIDEICGSTDPDEGAALARGFIDHYSGQGAFGLITSHLGALKRSWEKGSGVVNGSMHYDQESGGATYEFIMGLPGQSLAFSTAKQMGILDSIYNKAKAYLSPAGQKRLQSMEEVEQMKGEIRGLRAVLEKQTAQAQKKQGEYEQLQRQFHLEKEKRLEKEINLALGQFKEELKGAQVKNLFEAHRRRENIARDFPKMVKFSGKAQGQAKEDPQYKSLEAFIEAFPSGSVVFVTDLNADGIVQGEPNSKGEIPILSGSMRLFVPWEQLKPPKQTLSPFKQKNFHKSSEVVYDIKKDEIDLRGMTIQEALETLQGALDKAQAHQMERIRIIHGHGSEALKKAIRTHLSHSVYIHRWQVSPAHVGGDGVTMAYLM